MPDERIVFGEVKETKLKHPEHWSLLLGTWLKKNAFISPPEHTHISIPSYNHLTELTQQRIVNWLQPQEIARGESISGEENDYEGVLRYIIRIVYEEMFNFNENIKSVGGVLTHVPRDAAEHLTRDSWENILIGISNDMRKVLEPILCVALKQDAIDVLQTELANNRISEETKSRPETVEEWFIWSWEKLTMRARQILEQKKNEEEPSIKQLESLLNCLLTIRYLPQFQPLFTGYVFFDTTSIFKKNLVEESLLVN